MLTKLTGGYKNKVAKLEDKGKTYVAMFFDLHDPHSEEISYIHSNIDPLLKDKLPVRYKIDYVENPNQNVIIFNYVLGSTIPWEGYEMNHLKLLGLAMSNLHFELKELDTKLTDGIEVQVGQVYEMQKYFADRGVVKALEDKLSIKLNTNLEKYIKLFEEIKKQPIQTIHLDLVRGNILFATKDEIKNEDSKIFLTIDNELFLTGILDFEKVALGPRILDIARTLAFLIVDCKYKEEGKIRKYFLESGYNKRGKMKLPEMKYLSDLMEYFWLYDFFKFLYYTPYESLLDNEHFKRTLKELMKRDLILPK
ncbi:MAG: hypothetical protein WCO33_03920 [bacterium]